MVNIYALLNTPQAASAILAELGVDPAVCIQSGVGADHSCCFFEFESTQKPQFRKYWLNAESYRKPLTPVAGNVGRLQRLADHHGPEMLPGVVEQIELEITALLIQSSS